MGISNKSDVTFVFVVYVYHISSFPFNVLNVCIFIAS